MTTWSRRSPLRPALHDETGKLFQRRCEQAFRLKRGTAVLDQRHGSLDSALYPKKRRIGALLEIEVAAGGLPELVGGGRDVKNVICNLKREPD